MKEAYATFPPFQASMSLDGAGSYTDTVKAGGWKYSESSQYNFKAGHHVVIDLRGLTVKDKILKINNIHVARMPSFDNTFPKVPNASGHLGGIYQVTDMHLISTSPIVVETDIGLVGAAPANNYQHQLEIATAGFGGATYTTNNGYALPTPGILPGDAGNTNLPFFNLDPNMIVFCQTDVLTPNVQSNPAFQTMLNLNDTSTFGMGDLAALESLHCYRFVHGVWTSPTAASTYAGVIQAAVGPSILQLNTDVVTLPALERFQVMDTNYNTTNPLVE